VIYKSKKIVFILKIKSLPFNNYFVTFYTIKRHTFTTKYLAIGNDIIDKESEQDL
jgi:hypothetical protein